MRHSPFIFQTTDYRRQSLVVLFCLLTPGLLYGLVFDSDYLLKLLAILLFGWTLELFFGLMNYQKLTWPSVTTGITTGILLLSLPPDMPFHEVLYGVIVSVVFIKLFANKSLPIQLNSALIGRLFLMLFFADSVMIWGDGSLDVDGLTTATPLTMLKEAGFLYSIKDTLMSTFGVPWEEEYFVLPPAPADAFLLSTVALGSVLMLIRFIDWRLPTTFLLTYALANTIFLQRPIESVLLGGTLFSAIYVGGSPRHTPASKFGRHAAGILAGLLQAYFKKILYYPEVVVFTFLLVNLLSPSLDAFAAFIKAYDIRRRQF